MNQYDRIFNILEGEVKKKSFERLKREYRATGSPRNPETHVRALRSIRSAGVKPGKEGETYTRNITPEQRKKVWDAGQRIFGKTKKFTPGGGRR